ncbi:6-phosphogluconate dehydrogenase C-terminal domain-like protein [Bimuria novae-zelandiae CBS 107.79]|uniref:6-phosphogluconate dehydrogenase C-terminal domain-like protein n=1 Tax=Bimuria novae-zelandiae CBS 107.79 TaxID=1447943 RepID=A0A6A5V7G3_9PLEO|nr:6-phosphogluconate dehydrogenase C-terminal domain-like protein [Bimuria novae-zelandiae CBS 107.79]
MAAPLAHVGVLSIGQMGLGISRLLLDHGFHVITNASDRSIATQKRAKSASIECVSSDTELVARSDYIFSIVPPRDAMRTAKRICAVFERDPTVRAKGQHPLYYLELNAVSPNTARNIGAVFEKDNQLLRFLDGGIIGGPPAKTSGETTWTRPGIPLSGPYPLYEAPLHGSRLTEVLNTQHLDSRIGTASGLKCTFAALSKGFTALALQSFTTAASLGVLPQLQEYIAQYNPSVKDRAEKSIIACLPKAYRWVEEMNQIGQCFAGEGGWSETANVFRNVSNVYEQLATAVEERGGTEGMEDISGALSVLTESLHDGHKSTYEIEAETSV